MASGTSPATARAARNSGVPPSARLTEATREKSTSNSLRSSQSAGLVMGSGEVSMSHVCCSDTART